jgi:hypothetical protein
MEIWIPRPNGYVSDIPVRVRGQQCPLCVTCESLTGCNCLKLITRLYRGTVVRCVPYAMDRIGERVTSTI